MIPEGEQARAQVADICRRHNVVRLELFAYATGPNFDPDSSDIDLLVEFQPLPPVQYSNHYFKMLEELVKLFHRPVDLVISRALTNRYFLEASRTRERCCMPKDVRTCLLDIEQALQWLRQFAAGKTFVRRLALLVC